MPKSATERRIDPRYELKLPVHYRIAQKGEPAISGSGTTLDLSVHGLSFRCRKPLPVGVHIEVSVDWPARYGGVYPVELIATGFVVRSEHGRCAVRMTSHRLRVLQIPAEPVRVPA